MRRTLLMALALALVTLGVTILVIMQSFPSNDDIERVTIEEIAEQSPLLGQILTSPIIESFLDQTFGQTQEEVRDRVIEESRSAIFTGAAVYVVVLVAGVGLIAADHRRRHVGEGTPTKGDAAAS